MQKLREKIETIQQLTFQLQQMQEQMNSMKSSGKIKILNQITLEDCLTFPVNLK